MIAATSTLALATAVSYAQATALHSPCGIHAVKFEGWAAQEITNDWLRLTIVPQLGGRLMQVSFDGHSYLFVNPRYKGKYISPAEAAGSWINYGGDKVWPLPEGAKDERHWALQSGPLDDGAYTAKAVIENGRCSVSLEGPADLQTGIEYSRVISIAGDSPQISFHVVMKNVTGHSIEWSVQSVTQYDLSDPKSSGAFNRDFWAVTPVNPNSAYLEGFHVRSGLADDPSFQVSDGLFWLHWLYLENEVWIDSPAGWLAVIDNATGYTMVERFEYEQNRAYPGKATVIFYKNGPSIEMDENLRARLSSSKAETPPYYMEAEMNSPIVRLRPGETYAMETNWFPTRTGGKLSTVTEAGTVATAFTASWNHLPLENAGSANSNPGNTVSPQVRKILLSGVLSVFFPGKLHAHLYDERGIQIGEISVQSVLPQEPVTLHAEITVPSKTVRVSVHLVDDEGVDHGSMGEAIAVEPV
jgi:hypothetical protein